MITPAITEGEIENAILRPALDKTPGTDGIPNRVFRKITLYIFSHLHKLFNNCVNLAYHQRYFKKLITIVLQKPYGEEPHGYTSAKVYRPIALLNTLGKLLESVLAIRKSY